MRSEMKSRLVFIDDDPQELEDLRSIVEADYQYSPIRWPAPQPLQDLIGEPPAIFVLDLYFPDHEATPGCIPAAQLNEQAALSRQIAQRFLRLYDGPPDGKRLLRDTLSSIRAAYALLWAQCRELRQSAENGRALLQRLQAHRLYRRVPVVFYSRKATVEEALRALQAGALAVIPKPDSPPQGSARESVLAQIKKAQALHRSGWRARCARWLGLNVNLTMIKPESGSA